MFLIAWILFICATFLNVQGIVNVTCYDSSNGCDGVAQALQKCLKSAKPGDTCYIPEGRYGMEITISDLNGAENKPITIAGSGLIPNDTIIDGTVDISSLISPNTIWEKANINNNKCIYKILLNRVIWQLFVNNEMMTLSRWPNALWRDKTVFNSYYAQSLSTPESTLGVMVDKGTVYGNKLSSLPFNLTGTIAILNIGSWVTVSSVITKHEAHSSNFTYWVGNNWKNNGKPQNWRYYLESNINLIDIETEWYIDINTNILYLYSPYKCISLNNQTVFESIRGKIRTFSLNILDSSYININNLTFYSTGFNITSSNNIKYENIIFNFTTNSKRALNVYKEAPISSIFNNPSKSDVNKNGFSIINSIFYGSDGNIFSYHGNNGIFRNNLFSYISYSCVGFDNTMDGNSNGVASIWSNGINDQFTYNTISHFGPSVGYAPGLLSNISMNLIYNQSELQDDGAFIQVHVKQQNYSLIYKNWGYNSPKYAFRFDSANTQNAKTGENGTVSHVIAFNTSGIIIKGNKHNITSNVVFNSSINNNKYHADICIVGSNVSYAFPGENNQTITSNCGGVYISGSNSMQCVLPGYSINDIAGAVIPELINPNQFDFRPAPNSNYAINGIGPYLINDTEYWIPGRKQEKASFQIVSIYKYPDNIHNNQLNIDLIWRKAYNIKYQNIYLFNINKKLIKSVQFKHKRNIWKLINLKKNQKYFWRVDSIDINGNIHTGTLWSFTV